jgi:hypothetical protein
LPATAGRCGTGLHRPAVFLEQRIEIACREEIILDQTPDFLASPELSSAVDERRRDEIEW